MAGRQKSGVTPSGDEAGRIRKGIPIQVLLIQIHGRDTLQRSPPAFALLCVGSRGGARGPGTVEELVGRTGGLRASRVRGLREIFLDRRSDEARGTRRRAVGRAATRRQSARASSRRASIELVVW